VKTRQRALLDVYSVLGAPRSASWTELRRSYRAQARELHPDVQVRRPALSRLDQSRATALFTQLQTAWSLVATPERRAAYDLLLRAEPQPVARRRRPSLVPAWSVGPFVGVLLRTGPGDLHIAIPGGDWDLSLSRFLRRAADAARPPLLIGDLPPHPALREALRAADFVERHRLVTMVGLEGPAEARGSDEEELDENGEWKLQQLERALTRWASAFPGRRQELPYRADVSLMGRLSVSGYEINLPHPGGIYQALEPRPADRQEARRRNSEALLDLRLPSPALALVTAWAEDRRAMGALERGWDGLAAVAQLSLAEVGSAQRALEARRGRRDGYEPLPGSALDGGRPPAALERLLQALPTSRSWLLESGRGPGRLPWGEPLSQCGLDRRLGDAAARLVGRVLERLFRDQPDGVHLVAMRGARLRFRVHSHPKAAGLTLAASVRAAYVDNLGFPAEPEIGKG
jgi:curved DNA-binding protein CbpA